VNNKTYKAYMTLCCYNRPASIDYASKQLLQFGTNYATNLHLFQSKFTY